MCGIAGVLNLEDGRPVPRESLCEMIQALRHRGPDEFGIYRDPWVGLASSRLSIVDLAGGQQPISNEDDILWTVFNGEIFNYVELRKRMEDRGHRFSTNCDTEVVLHLYEEYGPQFLNQLNGQFAIAIWNSQERSLFLARDRVGIRPLYYTVQNGRLIFGSEIKSILVQPDVQLEIDSEALQQVFTYWSPLTPRSIFREIHQIPPGHYLIAKHGELSIERYWELDFSEGTDVRSEEEYLEEFEQLLVEATTARLMADVPVGAYLSGGVDSSVITTIIKQYADSHLDTFSIAFSDIQFDESSHQRQMAQFIGTHHQELCCTHEDIALAFPDVVWHTETPILRTAPAPMFLLSKNVNKHGYKVVLTGEGADEILAGYGIFKEMSVRRFWARQPDSQVRPKLLARLYPNIPRLSQNESFLRAFFQKGFENTEDPFYSHQIRWDNTGRIRRFISENVLVASDRSDGQESLIHLPEEFTRWSSLAQAQYLEMTTFLSTYLLSSQGDRVSMAHSVEGRYPFLDHRMIEFCNRLPPDVKLKGLNEKWLLKKFARKLVPSEIWQRTKRPYRAPIRRTFFPSGSSMDYVEELLSPAAIERTGYFKPKAVEMLVRKAKGETPLGEIDEMALVGILSTQLVDRLFIRERRSVAQGEIESRLKAVEVLGRATA